MTLHYRYLHCSDCQLRVYLSSKSSTRRQSTTTQMAGLGGDILTIDRIPDPPSQRRFFDQLFSFIRSNFPLLVP